jgi:chromosome segregation ATPase
MKPSYRRLALFFLLIVCNLTASCCKPGIKPEDANLFQAACGMMSGDFDRQIEEDKEAAKLGSQEIKKERSATKTLESDLDKKQVERDRLLNELVDLENNNRKLASEIDKLYNESVDAQQERAHRLAQLTIIQSKIKALRKKVSQEQTLQDSYQAELFRLKQEIETLRKIILSQ